MSTVGETLRDQRERRRITVDQASAETHIGTHHLQALEEDNHSAFPAEVYARGFLKSYASYLGLDPLPLLQEFSGRSSTPENGADRGTGRQTPHQSARPSSSGLSASMSAPVYGSGSEVRRSWSAGVQRRSADRLPRSSRTLRATDGTLGASSGGPLFPLHAGPSNDRPGVLLPLFIVFIVLALAATVYFMPWRSLHPVRWFQKTLRPHISVPVPHRTVAVHHSSQPPPSPKPTPRRDGLFSLSLRSRGWVYLSVHTDAGKERGYEGEWYPGLVKTWLGRNRIDVYADRGNNIDATLNGADLGRLATRRRKVWMTFTPGTTSISPAGSPAVESGNPSAPSNGTGGSALSASKPSAATASSISSGRGHTTLPPPPTSAQSSATTPSPTNPTSNNSVVAPGSGSGSSPANPTSNNPTPHSQLSSELPGRAPGGIAARMETGANSRPNASQVARRARFNWQADEVQLAGGRGMNRG